MKKILILLLVLMSASAVLGQEGTDAKKKVAVYVTGGSDANINKIIGSKLVQAIVNNGKYSAVERTDAIIAMLRKEQNYQHTGNVDDQQIGRLGKELGVNYVCIAEVVEAFGSKYISARLIDANVFEAIEFADVDGNINDMPSLVKMSESVANKLLGDNNRSVSSSNENKVSNVQQNSIENTQFLSQGGVEITFSIQGGCGDDKYVTIVNKKVAEMVYPEATLELSLDGVVFARCKTAAGGFFKINDNKPGEHMLMLNFFYLIDDKRIDIKSTPIKINTLERTYYEFKCGAWQGKIKLQAEKKKKK